MSSKERALLINRKNIEEETKMDKKADAAWYLLSHTRKGSLWFRSDTIRMLYFYLDLQFVRQELIKLYRDSHKEPEIQDLIKSMYDGTVDVDDLLEEMADLKDMKKSVELSQEEYLKEFEDGVDKKEPIEKDSSFELNQMPSISLLKYKASIIQDEDVGK